MYTYVSALLKPVGLGPWIQSNEVIPTKIGMLLSLYSDLYIQVSHSGDPEAQLYLSLTNILSLCKESSQTIVEWLDTVNTKLPTEAKPFDINKHAIVAYNDVYSLGFKARLGKANVHPETPLSRSQQPDLRLHHEIDLGEVSKSTIGVVANILVPVNFEYATLILPGATDIAERAKDYTVGLIDFSSVGTLTRVKLNRQHVVYREGINGTFETLIAADELANGIPLLVIMGLLMMPSDVVRVSDTAVKLTFTKDDYLKLILSVSDRVDVAAIVKAGGNVDMGTFTSREVYDKVLTHTLSYLYVLTGNDISIVESSIPYSGLPGKYLCHEVPNGIIVNNRKRVCNYETARIHDRYLLRILENRDSNYQATRGADDLAHFANVDVSNRRGEVPAMTHISLTTPYGNPSTFMDWIKGNVRQVNSIIYYMQE